MQIRANFESAPTVEVEVVQAEAGYSSSPDRFEEWVRDPDGCLLRVRAPDAATLAEALERVRDGLPLPLPGSIEVCIQADDLVEVAVLTAILRKLAGSGIGAVLDHRPGGRAVLRLDTRLEPEKEPEPCGLAPRCPKCHTLLPEAGADHECAPVEPQEASQGDEGGLHGTAPQD